MILSSVKVHKLHKTLSSLSTYLSVEVDESLGTVDVVEGCKTWHGAVDGHGMGPKLTPAC